MFHSAVLRPKVNASGYDGVSSQIATENEHFLVNSQFICHTYLFLLQAYILVS